MTYQRIGARNLRRLLSRGSPLVGVGDASPAGGRVADPSHAGGAGDLRRRTLVRPRCSARRRWTALSFVPRTGPPRCRHPRRTIPGRTADFLFIVHAHLFFLPPLFSRHFRDERLRAKSPARTRRPRPRGHDDFAVPWRRGGHARLRRRAATARARRAGHRPGSPGRTGATRGQLRARHRDDGANRRGRTCARSLRPAPCTVRLSDRVGGAGNIQASRVTQRCVHPGRGRSLGRRELLRDAPRGHAGGAGSRGGVAHRFALLCRGSA